MGLENHTWLNAPPSYFFEGGALHVETNGRESSLKGCFGADIDRAAWRPLDLPQVRRNARRFADALDSGENGDPSFRRAADMQKLIDAAFASSDAARAAAFG